MNLKSFNEQLNSSTDNDRQYDEWSTYRKAITTYTVSMVEGHCGKVLVLGAGNCNDLDLKVMGSRCDTLVLSDIDGCGVHEGLCRQTAQGVVLELDYLGVQDSETMDNLDEIIGSFDTKGYEQWLNVLVIAIKANRFVWKEQTPDVVIVMPIYTQLIYRQVEESLKISLLKDQITPDQYNQSVRSLLDRMPSIIKAFNKGLIDLVKSGAKLIVFSDYLEDNPEGYYSRKFGKKNFEDVYGAYYQQYGMGLGHYGMHDLEEQLLVCKGQWFKWPFAKDRVLFVKGTYFVGVEDVEKQ